MLRPSAGSDPNPDSLFEGYYPTDCEGCRRHKWQKCLVGCVASGAPPLGLLVGAMSEHFSGRGQAGWDKISRLAEKMMAPLNFCHRPNK